MFGQAALLSAFASSALAGTILWDGRFNDMTSSADLNNWSWSNEVGSYQYYIHGSGAVTEYVNLSPSYKNPADTGSKQGAKITIDSTSLWNSDMWRTELIPQTTAAINKGKVWYHFSMMRSGTNNPSIYNEHQVCFFESHFTEMKYGWINGESGTSDANLQWMVGGVGKWEVIWDANVWHNIAYEIDFSGGTVSFWHSTGSNALTLTAGPFTASASSNGEDWHLGVLRLPRDGYTETTPEDWYFSGVYVESGSLTTAIGNGSSTSTGTGTGTGTTTSAPASNPTTSKAATPTTSSTSSGSTGTAAEWAQCGGIGYSGPTTCASGYTCHVVNDYYSQCY